MTAQSFDDERLDVFRLSTDYVARPFEAAQLLAGLYRHACDQWLRAAQSFRVGINEDNGKRSLKDRARFLDMARGCALKCSAIQDVLLTTLGIKVQDDALIKAMLRRIAMKFDGVAESIAAYDAEIDYDNEHRCAEHEHGAQTDGTPEPWDATERRWHGFS
jgi:hypothetical protein